MVRSFAPRDPRGDIVQNAYATGCSRAALGMHYGGEALGAT